MKKESALVASKDERERKKTRNWTSWNCSYLNWTIVVCFTGFLIHVIFAFPCSAEISRDFTQGHLTTGLCQIRKNCLEFSIAWGRLKSSRWQFHSGTIFEAYLINSPRFSEVGNQGIGLYSQNVYRNQRVLRSSIYIEPVFTSREECNAFEDLLFFRRYFCLWRDFCHWPACPFAARDFSEDSSKLLWGINRICGPFVLKMIILPFERLFVLCHSLIRSCISFKFIFFYLWYIPPHSCAFTHFTYTNFFICILLCWIFFFLSLMMPLIGESSEFNFSFQF